MGSMLQGYKLTEADYRGERFQDHPYNLQNNVDILNLTQPRVVAEIHRAYLEAGADIIETNTFTATSISQADFGLEDYAYEINLAAAQIARAEADAATLDTPDKPRYVAGAMGPMNKSASISIDVNSPASRSVTFDELKAAYKEQARGLMDGGVDLLLVETIIGYPQRQSGLLPPSMNWWPKRGSTFP